MLMMRIVGLSESTHFVTVQIRDKDRGRWKQIIFPYNEFGVYMKHYFPKYYNYYEMAMEQQENYEYAAEWFYNYGETFEMRRKGDSYIFKNWAYRRYEA